MTTSEKPSDTPRTDAERHQPLEGLASASCSQIWLAAIFAAYSVAYEAIVWGIFGYAIFWQGHSGWWVIVALLISGAQMKPHHFGITSGKDDSANDPHQLPPPKA